MRADSIMCYDQREGCSHSKAQVIIARRLASKRKQPIFYDFDKKYYKRQTVRTIIVSDMGGGNLCLWKNLQISASKVSFTNHLIKLLRNNFLDYGIRLVAEITTTPHRPSLNIEYECFCSETNSIFHRERVCKTYISAKRPYLTSQLLIKYMGNYTEEENAISNNGSRVYVCREIEPGCRVVTGGWRDDVTQGREGLGAASIPVAGRALTGGRDFADRDSSVPNPLPFPPAGNHPIMTTRAPRSVVRLIARPCKRHPPLHGGPRLQSRGSGRGAGCRCAEGEEGLAPPTAAGRATGLPPSGRAGQRAPSVGVRARWKQHCCVRRRTLNIPCDRGLVRVARGGAARRHAAGDGAGRRRRRVPLLAGKTTTAAVSRATDFSIAAIMGRGQRSDARLSSRDLQTFEFTTDFYQHTPIDLLHRCDLPPMHRFDSTAATSRNVTELHCHNTAASGLTRPSGNSAPINERFTTVCPNHVQFTQKGSDLTSRQQPMEKRRRLENVQLDFTVPAVLQPASFLHWLLHRCEATPFLTELHVRRDKISVKHVHTEVDFVIGSQFIRHALDNSEPIADWIGNTCSNIGHSPGKQPMDTQLRLEYTQDCGNWSFCSRISERPGKYFWRLETEQKSLCERERERETWIVCLPTYSVVHWPREALGVKVVSNWLLQATKNFPIVGQQNFSSSFQDKLDVQLDRSSLDSTWTTLNQ
ncbi:hypothetical protein PR048_033377 [Dryococelus australis]|uniref:SWIM-type domain-containing protein n=1 Tax=Dryococelus australis TaxID=614101 RepID=A0ABQ9G043_9NEOP|nr:hypothetical protein PR048_033377 [Dryococelus australis]